MHALLSRSRSLSVVAFAALCAAAGAQVVNPADKQRPPDPLPGEIDVTQVPTTTVTAKRVSQYREEDRVGEYGQPEWTTQRLWPTTRVYVRPPGSFAFEYWMRPTIPREGPTELQTQYEFEMGLPNRFQFDMYIVSNQEGNDGPMVFDEQKFEIRYALADWGKIWGNPTLYGEIVHRDSEADVIEAKLLFGDEIRPGLHWGTNLVYEHEMGGDQENVYELTAGVSQVIRDSKLSIGGETKIEFENVDDDGEDVESAFLVGPTLQYRPTAQIHLDVVALAGLGGESPEAQGFFVLGYEF